MFRKVAIILLLLSAQYASAAVCHLTLRVSRIRNSKGLIRVAVFRTAQGFPGDAAGVYRKAEVSAKEGDVQVTLKDLPEGEYAIAVIHDEDSNGILNTGFLGIPSEGFGVSNNPEPKVRAPRYSEAKFQLSGAVKELDIHLIYYL